MNKTIMRNNKNINFEKKLFIVFFIFLNIHDALSDCNEAKKKLIESIAEVTEEPILLYRTGKGIYERERFNKKPAFDMNQVNFSLSHAGQGLYAATQPYETLQYLVSKDPELVEIEIQKGTKIIDLKLPEIRNKLKSHNLVPQDIYSCNPKALVRFNSSPNSLFGAWAWVIKDPDLATIRPFQGNQFSTNELLIQMNSIKDLNAKKFFVNKINQTLHQRPFIPDQLNDNINNLNVLETCTLNQNSENSFFWKLTDQFGFLGFNKPKLSQSKYFWKYDGTCGEYKTQNTENRFIQSVDSDYCRKIFPTTFSSSFDGKCHEVVQQEPQLHIHEVDRQLCNNSSLYCERKSEHLFSIDDSKMPSTHSFKNSYYISAESCLESIALAQSTSLLCINGEVPSLTSTSSSLFIDKEAPAFESLNDCYSVVKNRNDDLKMICLVGKESKYEVYDYSEPHQFMKSSFFNSYSTQEECFRGLLSTDQTKVIQSKRDQQKNKNYQSAKELLSSNQTGSTIITELKNLHPSLKELFNLSAQVKENYSVEEHTNLVLNQFNKQKKYYDLEKISKKYQLDLNRLMRTTIIMHDIGKGIGETTNQHYYTVPIVKDYMQKWNYSQKEIDLAIELINHDMIGETVRGIEDLDTTLEKIKDKANTLKMSPQDFAKLQMLFYISDSSSYPSIEKEHFQTKSNGQMTPKTKALKQMESSMLKLKK